jgi:hypothetical protein
MTCSTTRRILIAACVLVLGSLGAYAQNTTSTPKPMATPPVVTGAEIISRASDFTEPAPTAAKEPDKAVKQPETGASLVRELSERLKKLEENQKTTYDEKQRRLLLNLDILTRAEQRSESLRKQLFEMAEKENALKSRLDQIDIEMRPEVIERSLQLAGSLRPEDVRDARRRSLAAEKANVQSLLTHVQTTKAALDLNLQRADQMVEKLRIKLEKDIDEALKDDTDN